MSDFEVCPCGTLQRLAAVEAEREALLVTLGKIAGFTLSQFMGPHDMALECVTVARAASSAARRRR